MLDCKFCGGDCFSDKGWRRKVVSDRVRSPARQGIYCACVESKRRLHEMSEISNAFTMTRTYLEKFNFSIVCMLSLTDVRKFSSSFFFYVCMNKLLWSGHLFKKDEKAEEQWSIYKFTFGLRWQIVLTAWYFMYLIKHRIAMFSFIVSLWIKHLIFIIFSSSVYLYICISIYGILLFCPGLHFLSFHFSLEKMWDYSITKCCVTLFLQSLRCYVDFIVFEIQTKMDWALCTS